MKYFAFSVIRADHVCLSESKIARIRHNPTRLKRKYFDEKTGIFDDIIVAVDLLHIL